VSSKTKLVLAILSIALLPEIAMAYVGPGAGISLLGALWGLIVGVVMALGIVLFWPIRMMMRKRKAAAEAKNTKAPTDTPEAAENTDASETNADNNT
jgi:type VI protein secretion system component VasK